MVASRFVKLSE